MQTKNPAPGVTGHRGRWTVGNDASQQPYSENRPKTQRTPPNRAERRRQQAEQRRRMQAMGEQAQGLYEADIFRVGTPPQRWQRTAILGWLAHLNTRPLCLLCDHDFFRDGPPGGFVFIKPHRDDLRVHLSVSGICGVHTALDDAALSASVVAKLRATVLPGLRVLDPANLVPGGGRA